MRHLTNDVRAVEGPGDVSGRKIRTPQATYPLRTLERMGANATPMAFNELYTAMRQGVVDGQENPLSKIYNAAFCEVNDHLALTGHLHLTHMVLYSQSLWEDLSPEHREIVRQAVLDSAVVQRETVASDDANLPAELEGRGMQVTRPDRAALAEPVAPLREEAVAEFGEVAERLLDLVYAARDELT